MRTAVVGPFPGEFGPSLDPATEMDTYPALLTGPQNTPEFCAVGFAMWLGAKS